MKEERGGPGCPGGGPIPTTEEGVPRPSLHRALSAKQNSSCVLYKVLTPFKDFLPSYLQVTSQVSKITYIYMPMYAYIYTQSIRVCVYTYMIFR